VRELVKQFVPATDEVWRLQNDDEPECRFFRKTVLGNEAPTRGSMQGTYVFAPSGKLLARLNSNNSDAIAELLEKAWSKWEKLPASERQLLDPDSVEPGFRFEQLYPKAGLVLRRTARDLPALGKDQKIQAGKRFNRDAIWLSADEAHSLLPKTLELGQRQQLPAQLTKRFACLVFVDNVRGQTIPYHPSEDRDSSLWAEVEAIQGTTVTIKFSGQTAAFAKGPWLFKGKTVWDPPQERQYSHSISIQVLGNATYDTAAKKFIAFELLALGTRSGRTINNGRATLDPSGVGFACELAPLGWTIPPTFIDVYDVEWASPPK